jgi:hypothetical protein
MTSTFKKYSPENQEKSGGIAVLVGREKGVVKSE